MHCRITTTVFPLLVASLLALPGAPALAAAPPATATPTAAATAGDSAAEFLWRASNDDSPQESNFALAVAPDGNVWVGHGGANQFRIFSPDGAFIEAWGEAGKGEGQFTFKGGEFTYGAISFTPDGGFYVADTGNRRVQQFDANRQFVRAFGEFGSGDGQFLEPIDVDVAPDGRIFVIDDKRDDVQVFTAEGEFVQTISRHGSGDGEVSNVGAGAFDHDGAFWVADWDNHRVQQFAPDGAFLQAMGAIGAGPGQFIAPISVAVDAKGRVYVGDERNRKVVVLAPNGEVLADWTGDDLGGTMFGTEEGGMTNSGVFGLYLDDDTLYVNDYRSPSAEGPGLESTQAFKLLPPLAP